MSRNARHRAPTKPLVDPAIARTALTATGALVVLPAALVATAGAAQAYTDNGDGTVTVQSGDTVSQIAHGTGNHTQAVLDSNGLGWSSTIFPGQKIVLAGPAKAQPGPAPTVRQAAAPSRSATRTVETVSNTVGTSNDTAAAPVNTSGEAATSLARGYIGTPYVWGGATPAAGFDCSGLVQYVYGKLGVSLPRTTGALRTAGYAVSTPRVGDLVLFDDIGHVGIYAGGGKIIDAPKPGESVKERTLWTDRVQFRRVV